MARLTDAQRAEHHAEFMRQLSRTRTVVGAMNKFALRALLDAHLDAVETGVPTPLVLPAVDESNFAGRTLAIRLARKAENDAKLGKIVVWTAERIDRVTAPATVEPARITKEVTDGIR